MENFNKNWLIILLVAVVFGALGFLVGRTTGVHNGHRVMKWQGDGENEFVIEKDMMAVMM